MRAEILLLLSATSLTGCGEKQLSETEERRHFLTETSNGTEGVGTADKPVETMIYGMTFQQAGLEVEDAMVFVEMPDSAAQEGRGIKYLDAKAPAWGKDTVWVGIVTRGWKVMEDRGTMGYRVAMRAPDGRIAHEYETSPKTVLRWSVDSFDTFTIDFSAAGLDTTVPYYDCEYRVWDKLSRRSLAGSYRLHLRKANMKNAGEK